MKIYCFAILFIMYICMGCVQAPRLSDPASDTAGNSSLKEDSLPSVSVSENIHEFSPVPDGTIVSYDFVIKNTGTAVLTLSRISAG